MKTILIIVTVIMSLSFLSAEMIDYIVAKVGREAILKSDLERQINQMRQLGAMTPEITEADVLNDMIESRLILQTARERNYRLDEFRIRQMIDSQIQSQIERIGSEEALREELRKAGMTMSDLREFYEQMIREQRLKEMFIQNEITNRIHITEIEIDEFYREKSSEIPWRPEKVELGMIKQEIAASERTKKEVLADINRVYDKIIEGKDFAALAKEESDCPSATNGGDLGFFGPGTMIKEFEETAFALKVGEISKVVQTHFGYHIIKMEEKDEEDIRVRHILKMIEPTEEDITETITIMDEVQRKLAEGEDFQQLAKEYSDDDSAPEGGIIGEFSGSEYPEMFSEQLKNIEVGEFTEVIRQGENLYIFGKLRIIPERPFELAEIRDELREYLQQEKQVDQYESWIENLRSESYVEIFSNR
jgi:peptidyl-prolyl cis-trans isomerase SurA